MNPSAPLSFGPLSLLLILGVFHGLFLSALLLSSSGEIRGPNRVFALLIVLFTLTIADAVVEYSNLIYRLPRLYQTTYPLQYLIGPLFLFYFRALSGPGWRLRRRDAAHLVPFLLAAAVLAPFVAAPDRVKIADIEAFRANDFYPVSFFAAAAWLAPLLQRGVYLLVTLRRIGGLDDELQHRDSDNDRIFRLRWFGRLARTYSWFLFLYSLGFIAAALGGIYWYKFDYLTVLANSIFIHGIGYAAIRQPALFHPVRTGPDTATAAPAAARYRTSSLSEEEGRAFRDRLLETMSREEPYLRSDLKLADLAELVGVPSHQLSQVLNQRIGQAFFEFVNRYRVERAQELLADPRNRRFTVLAIGFEAGFNNKTSFNHAFKQVTGMTPSDFRAKQRVS